MRCPIKRTIARFRTMAGVRRCVRPNQLYRLRRDKYFHVYKDKHKSASRSSWPDRKTMPCTQEQPKKRDRSNENFKKRWRTFVKNGFLTHRDYHADVYILLRRNGQTYEFKSTDQAWPLTAGDLVRTPWSYTLRCGKLIKSDRKSVSLSCSR